LASSAAGTAISTPTVSRQIRDFMRVAPENPGPRPELHEISR
jgi:hypothetical protein